MKALSLLQPWASLWATNPTLKLHETRSWNTKYRGPLAIHASAKKDKAGRKLWEYLWHKYRLDLLNARMPREFDLLPFGAILSIISIEDTFPTSKLDLNELTRMDLICGDFGINRFAWRRGPVTDLLCPATIKGQLGLWNWEPTAQSV